MTGDGPLADVKATPADEAVLAIEQFVLEAIPAAVYLCAADGVIVRFNRRAAELWGREPKAGDPDERFCGSHRLYDREGRPVPHAATPMALALRDGEPQHDQEVTIERPDGSRIIALVNIDPLKDSTGRVRGAINCFLDITARKRAEEELRASRADLEDFFENAVVPMHWVGGDGTVLRANRAELDLLGYARDEYVGRHIAQFHADRATIDGILARLSRGEVLDKAPATLRTKDGSLRHVVISSSGSLRNGELVNTRCVTVDVTAERRAEEIRRDSEHRYRRLLEALPVAVYTTDAAGRITYYNQAATELWGCRPELNEQRWCGAWKLRWPDGTPVPHDSSPMAVALKEDRPVRGMECIAERPDGTRVPMLPFPTPLHDAAGRLTGAVSILVDMTDRQRAERARQQLAAIVESSDDAILSTNLDGTIASWNPGAARLFGYAADEARGKPMAMLLPPGGDPREAPDILDRIRSGRPVAAFDTVRRRKDGTLIDVSLTLSPLKDARGRIVGASTIARDITQRRRAEDALARRIDEQVTLYRLTDKLHRATSSGDVYEAALDAIGNGLRCQRASILLFDAAGVMRFVAWRGLSEAYRDAVEGHSPWTPDARDPRPICIDDIQEGELAEELRATIRGEGIGALAFIPLVTGGRLIGKFMFYYDAPHAFADGEVELAVAIARQLGFGVDRLRAEEVRRLAEKELRESEARERANAAELQTIMEAVPAIIWIARDPECRVIGGNPASYAALRLPPGVNQSQSAPEPERPVHFEMFAEGRPLGPEELPVQRAARGEEVRNFEVQHRFRDGTSRYLFGNATPLRDPQGRPSGAVAAFVDITDRKRAEKQRDLLVAELSHRVKNTLAIVISIARQSFATKADVNEARRSFEARIRVLAEIHSRLAESHWAGASFETMLRDGLAPHRQAGGGSVSISGPTVTFAPKCALTLGMTIHELAANAAKYGALSTEGGAVDVVWQVDDDSRRCRIRWTERGGPAVAPPRHKGFGRLLIEQALCFDLSAEVELDFAKDGLRCAIAIPLDGHVARLS